MKKLLTAACLACAAMPANAALTLDQSSIPDSFVPGRLSTDIGTQDFIRWSQVVTAGKSGLLGRIDIATNSTTAPTFGTFNILTVEGGIPTSTVLGTASYSSFADGIASFTSSILVNEGQQFALHPTGNTRWLGQRENVEDYIGGSASVSYSSNPEWQLYTGGIDQRFRTFVSELTPTATAAVPEPATWALMLTGFGAVGAAMRRRRKSAVFA